MVSKRVDSQTVCFYIGEFITVTSAVAFENVKVFAESCLNFYVCFSIVRILMKGISSLSYLGSPMSRNARASLSQSSLLNCVVHCDLNPAATRLTAYSFRKLSAMLMWQQQGALA